MRLLGCHISTREYNEADEVAGVVQLLLHIDIITKHTGMDFFG